MPVDMNSVTIQTTVAECRLGIGQDVGAHTGAGGACTNAIEAGAGADGLQFENES